jgi:serine/threonine-protein kinase
MEWATEQGYTIMRAMGSGGEGHVYLCEKNGVIVALKAVPELNEGQIDILNRVNGLNSQYFPRIHEIINDAGKTYILREYIEGSTLYEELKKNGCFSYSRAKQIFFELCDALGVLHNAKPEPIIHRDLKPENVIITPQGNARLIDFGIARSYKPEAARDTVLAGTDGYTAPEVRAGFQSDRRSDIYSLGMLLYEMLSGKSILEPPFQIRPLCENNLYLPRELDAVIAKAVNPQQIARYRTAEEFKSAVESIRDESPRRSRRPLRYFIYGVLAALILFTSAIFFSGRMVALFNTDVYAEDYAGRNLDEVCDELLEKISARPHIPSYPANTGKAPSCRRPEKAMTASSFRYVSVLKPEASHLKTRRWSRLSGRSWG